jgi:hypothetical protein
MRREMTALQGAILKRDRKRYLACVERATLPDLVIERDPSWTGLEFSNA